MEEDGDFNSSSSSCCNQEVAKGQRTKRRRARPPPPPPPGGPTTTTTTTASSAPSAEFSSSITDEDEDMANCLVLLSRGRSRTLPPPAALGPSSVFECRTCSKRFLSFQALGGHRASHKKPRPTPSPEEIASSDSSKHPPPPDKSRVHECAICGLEFSSGQALGGHMRRHRPIVAVAAEAPAPDITNKERISSVISLDLNLPAPDDDDSGRQQLGFAIVDGQRPIVFSAAVPLVDCQY